MSVVILRSRIQGFAEREPYPRGRPLCLPSPVRGNHRGLPLHGIVSA